MALPSSSKRKIFDERYEILSIVGRGEDSVVYRARHISGSAQDVALKVLVKRNNESNLSDKLRKEALTLVSCRTKHVVRLDDFHSVDDICYLSMEFAPHGDLTKYSQHRAEPLPTSQVVSFLKQCLEALDFIHATGVIHRDIKPENILVMSESEIRMADFGLALLPGDGLDIDELKKGVGTLAYLPPETLQGITYDARSDLYALGLSFVEILTGHNPFSDLPLAGQLEARRNLQTVRTSLESATVPEHVRSLLLKLLAFEPKERFSSAQEALQAIDNPSFRFEVGPSNTDADDNAPHSESQVIAIPDKSTSQFTRNTQIANNDTPNKPAVESTERIDLDRIKSLIKEKSTPTTQRNQNLKNRTSETITTPVPALPPKHDQSIRPVAHRGSAKPTRLKAQGTLKTFIVITGGFALLTVLVLLSVRFLSNGDNHHTPVTSDKTTGAPNKSALPKQLAPALESLPLGIHSGVVRGLFPQGDVPLVFVSNPTKRTLTLIFGVPGWLPTESSTITATGSPTQEYIFRSNGLILKFNQEMPSATITGTVTDIVTGTTGSWAIQQP